MKIYLGKYNEKKNLHEKAPLMDQNISDYVALFASRLVVTLVKDKVDEDNGWLQSKLFFMKGKHPRKWVNCDLSVPQTMIGYLCSFERKIDNDTLFFTV